MLHLACVCVCVCMKARAHAMRRSGIAYAIVSWWGRSGSSSGDSQGWVGDDAFLVQLLHVSLSLAISPG